MSRSTQSLAPRGTVKPAIRATRTSWFMHIEASEELQFYTYIIYIYIYTSLAVSEDVQAKTETKGTNDFRH